MNNQQPEAFGMNPNFPPILNPAWNPNNWNQNQNQAIRNLENRVTRLEREVRRLDSRVNRLEQSFPTPFRDNTTNYQVDSYNMM